MKYFLPILLFLSISCERVIDLETPDFESKISAIGFISPENEVRVYIFPSKGILDQMRPTGLSGAQVRLYENDIFAGEMKEMNWHGFEEPTEKEVSDPQKLVYGLNFFPTSGNEYSIEIVRDGFAPVLARTIIPISRSEVAISLVEEQENYFNAEITIDDPAGEDFYELVVYGSRLTQSSGTNGPISYGRIYHPLRFESSSVVVKESNPNGFSTEVITFNDDLFDGNKTTIRISFYAYKSTRSDLEIDPENRIHIDLRTITKEYFLYKRTFRLSEENLGGPFSESVQIFSNVENGLGVFAGYQSNIWEFDNE